MNILFSLFLLGAVNPGEELATRLSQRLDRLYRADSSHAKMSMSITTPDYQRTLELESWSRGMDYTLVRILSPRKEKGISTLKREKEMWNYLPRIQKTIRVPASMMMGSWMGSDLSNDDLMRESSWEKDYSVKLSEDSPEDQICLDYIPKPSAAVTWSRVQVCLARENELPLFYDYYDEKGRKARRMSLDEIKEVGGRKIPSRMTRNPLLKKNHKTVIIYQSLEFGLKHDEGLFSLNRLRRGR